ncbi:hypothetical protein CBS101457_003543 [Exobasidium rhododendri]|nr:hypothetical protein CBS101457_003543 [Exobasidium rhododendri]
MPMPSSSNSPGHSSSWFPPSHSHSHGHSYVSSMPSHPFHDARSQNMHTAHYPLTNSAYVGSTYAEVPVYHDRFGREADEISEGTSTVRAPVVGGVESGGASKSINDCKASVKGVSPPTGEDDDADENKGSKKKRKLRRRVIQACSTCRRKKVKCEGLPNSSNTCNNCQNMGYNCTFPVEPDRIRGRYEILEAQKDTILAALRKAAPEVADQFERGEFSQNILNDTSTVQEKQIVEEKISDTSKVDAVRQGSSSGHLLSNVAEGGPSSVHDGVTLTREPKQNLGPMIPDLEDGRPRYYGGSSNLTNFHNLDSRPPSPGLGHRRGGNSSGKEESYSRDAVHALAAGNTVNVSVAGGDKSSSNRLAVLPRPRPQYPSNSVGWVRHVRKKNLVAVGRDDDYGFEGWFQYHQFPEPGLLEELIKLFFNQLNPLLPIIHEHSLRKDLIQGRAEKDSAFRGLIFTIIAIASRFFSNDARVLADKEDPTSAGDHWAAASRFHHQVYAASLINVQVLLLSTTFMPSSLGMGPTWTILGVAIRALQDIGLHTEKAYVDFSPFEQEMRRRTFWAAFILDGVLSINMGRPSALRLADTSVNFPLLVSEEALMKAEASGGPVEEQSVYNMRPCPVAGFIHLIELNIIAQDVVNTLYAPRYGQSSEYNARSHAYTSTVTQRSPATYKDMTILSKRLDEWAARIPSHLQTIQGSPYKEQACLLQCGKNDIRLYILKPFLQDSTHNLSQLKDRGGKAVQEDSILRKMLLPQCVSHAKECLRLLVILWEDEQLSHKVFLLQQAFLSAATFMLTVWHETNDFEALGKDKDLIEATLVMFKPEENQFCSVLLRRAQRILCNIAQRTMKGIDDEAQKERMRGLIDLHDTNRTAAEASKKARSRRQSNYADAAKVTSMSAGGLVGEKTPEKSESSRGNSATNDQNVSKTTTTTTNDLTPSNFLSSADHQDLVQLVNQHPATTSAAPRKDGRSRKGNGGVEQQWLEFADYFDPAAMQNDASEVFHEFELASDLSWTNYFSKFLGSLPNPVNSPFPASDISSFVNQTP